MKALFVMMIAVLAINVSYAGYGEDAKGECKKGTDSSRGQEAVSSGQSSAGDAKTETSSTKIKKK